MRPITMGKNAHKVTPKRRKKQVALRLRKRGGEVYYSVYDLYGNFIGGQQLEWAKEQARRLGLP